MPDRDPSGARGPHSDREFDPSRSGGPIRNLDWRKAKITSRGVDAVERHLARFGADSANERMIARLRAIAEGKLSPTDYDRRFYTHELREYVRYRRTGNESGAGDDYELWNDAHTATLEDYGLHEVAEGGGHTLYHPDTLEE